jgi:hypothetical protein
MKSLNKLRPAVMKNPYIKYRKRASLDADFPRD